MEVKINDIIEKELEGLEDFVVAVISSAENYYSANIAILDYLVNKRKMNGIYITMNKPYFSLVNVLKKNNIDANNLFFIDAISGVVGQESELDNCIVLRSPVALGELGISVLNLCETGDAKFLLLDSLSTMVIYNNVLESVKFSHYIITNLRKYHLAGVIMSLEADTKFSFIKDISMFVDKVISLK